jgi:hypothetical protein
MTADLPPDVSPDDADIHWTAQGRPFVRDLPPSDRSG